MNGPKAAPEVTQSVSLTAAAEQTVSTIRLLPDTATENMTDSVLSISLEEGGAYVGGTGKIQMDMKIYTYDKYDMVDVSMLKVGDVLGNHAEKQRSPPFRAQRKRYHSDQRQSG